MTTSDQFYLQDSRQSVGNDMMLWAETGGYTSDVSKAAVFTKDEAQRKHNCRETDIPWPKAYIDRKTRPAVDVQHVQSSEALEGTGITLTRPEKYPKNRYRCRQCNEFLGMVGYYKPCPKCGWSSHDRT